MASAGLRPGPGSAGAVCDLGNDLVPWIVGVGASPEGDEGAESDFAICSISFPDVS